MSVRNVAASQSSSSVSSGSSEEVGDLRFQQISDGALIPRILTGDLYLSQFDRQVDPLIRAFTTGPRADQPQMVFAPHPNKSWHLTGMEIGSLLIQLRAFVPVIGSVSPEMRANYPVDVVMPQGEVVQIKAGMIPEYISEMRKLVQPSNHKLLTRSSIDHFVKAPSDEYERKDQFEELSRRDFQEVLFAEKSSRQELVDNLHSWIFDPGNPEKGKKYEYSLYSTRCALDQKFRGWKGRLLPELLKLSSDSAFARSAYFALNSLKDHAESDEEIRAQYAYILSNIREALGHIPSQRFDTPELRETLQLILYFCHFKFTRVHIYPFLNDFIPKVLAAPRLGENPYEMPVFTLKDFSRDIQIANDRLLTAPPEYRQTLFVKEFKKFKGAIGWGFDPNGDSNTPWVHSIQEAETEQGARLCTVLRHGTPTIDPGLLGTVTRIVQNILRWVPSQQALVIPEYRALLAADPEKVFLYVNHQEYDGTGQYWVTAERDRTRALQQLERDYKNFNFLSLPMDGTIWEKAFLEKASMQQLKEGLFEALMTQSHGFSFPRDLMKLEEHKARVIRILDEVHKLYFRGEELSPEAKKAFIVLFYSELKDYLKNVLRVDYVASPCKDNKDRGNVSTTVDMMKNLVKLGLENDPNRLREVFISVLAPFIIKNEHILEGRLGIALSVINVFAGLSEAEKGRIRERPISGYQIKKQTVPKEKASWSQMVGQKKFIAFVENMKRLREKRVVPGDQLQDQLVSTYLRDGLWNLAALKAQIVRDMPCCELRLNGERMLQFDAVCSELDLNPKMFNEPVKDSELPPRIKGALRFLAMFQQGMGAESMRDPSQYLNGNAAELVVAMPILPPLREKIHDIITLSRSVKGAALESAKKTTEADPLFVNYLRSAVLGGLLPEEFMLNPPGDLPRVPIYPTCIDAKYSPETGAWDYVCEQELDLRDPDGKKRNYPISAMVTARPDQLAKLSWHFTT